MGRNKVHIGRLSIFVSVNYGDYRVLIGQYWKLIS